MGKRICVLFVCFSLVLSLTACQKEKTTVNHEIVTNQTQQNSGAEDAEQTTKDKEKITAKEEAAMKMNVQIGDYAFTATLEDNEAAHELLQMMKKGFLSISMSDYSGFEKVGSLGTSLTTSNQNVTTSSGDIVLYNGNKIVMFYGSNSWSYTKIGKIDDLSNWEKALGRGSIGVVFTLTE